MRRGSDDKNEQSTMESPCKSQVQRAFPTS